MEVHAAADGGWTFEFFSRESEQHICVAGFVRRRLDLHKFEKWRHELLGLWILDTGASDDGYIIP